MVNQQEHSDGSEEEEEEEDEPQRIRRSSAFKMVAKSSHTNQETNGSYQEGSNQEHGKTQMEQDEMIAQQEASHQAQEKAQLAQQEAQRQAQERAQLAQQEASHQAQERAQLAQQEAQRQAQERAKLAQQEAQRQAQERAQVAQRQAQERAQLAQQEAQRQAQERAQLAQQEAQRQAQERAQLAQQEAQRQAQERAKLAQQEAQRQAQERAQVAQRQAQEKARLSQKKAQEHVQVNAQQAQERAQMSQKQAQRQSVVGLQSKANQEATQRSQKFTESVPGEPQQISRPSSKPGVILQSAARSGINQQMQLLGEKKAAPQPPKKPLQPWQQQPVQNKAVQEPILNTHQQPLLRGVDQQQVSGTPKLAPSPPAKPHSQVQVANSQEPRTNFSGTNQGISHDAMANFDEATAVRGGIVQQNYLNNLKKPAEESPQKQIQPISVVEDSAWVTQTRVPVSDIRLPQPEKITIPELHGSVDIKPTVIVPRPTETTRIEWNEFPVEEEKERASVPRVKTQDWHPDQQNEIIGSQPLRSSYQPNRIGCVWPPLCDQTDSVSQEVHNIKATDDTAWIQNKSSTPEKSLNWTQANSIKRSWPPPVSDMEYHEIHGTRLSSIQWPPVEFEQHNQKDVEILQTKLPVKPQQRSWPPLPPDYAPVDSSQQAVEQAPNLMEQAPRTPPTLSKPNKPAPALRRMVQA